MTRASAGGFECGIGLSDYQDLKDGDIIETSKSARSLARRNMAHSQEAATRTAHRARQPDLREIIPKS